MDDGRNSHVVAGLLSIIVVMLLLDVLLFPFLVDDSFISYRYALNLKEGRGLVFNPGERVEGYSNFLWVVILAGLAVLDAPLIMASKILGIIFGIGSVLVAFLLSKRFSESGGLFLLTSVALVAIDIGFVRWSVAGMETQLATFLLLLAILFFAAEMEGGSKVPLSALFFGLCSLTRPEAPILFLAALLFRAWRKRKDWAISDSVWVASYVAVFLPFLLFRLLYYGSLLPNSYYAKTGGGLKKIAVGIRYVNQFFGANGGWLLLPLCFIPFISKRSRLSCLYPFLLAHMFFVVYVGGDHMDDYRFLIPILPLVFILTQEGLRELTGLLKRWGRVVLVLTVLGLLLSNCVHDYYKTAVIWWGDAAGQLERLRVGMKNPEELYDRAEVGLWLKENVGSDMVVAVEDCGMIPYYSGLRTIDMFGLMDVHLARLQGMMHQKFDATYVLNREPDVIILIRYPQWLWDEPFWQSNVDRELASSERFAKEYRILHRVYGSERWFLIYERRS